jgi:hypothetical protein
VFLDDVHTPSREVEELCSDIGHARRCYDHAEELHQLRGRRRQAEREDVFVSLDGVVVRQSRKVARVVKHSVSFRLDKTRIVLTEAFEAPTAGRSNMSSPLGAAHATRPDLHHDATVDNRNQVGVCDQIEGGACPGTIDAAEEHIAVERLTESLRLADRVLARNDVRIRGCGAFLEH